MRKFVTMVGVVVALALLPLQAVSAEEPAVPPTPTVDRVPLQPMPEPPDEESQVVGVYGNTCGFVTCTYYFGKATTKDIANIKGGGPACGAALKYLPGIAKIAAVACLAIGGAVKVQAQRAVNRDMCLKIKYTRPMAPFAAWPDIYKGKRCK